MAKEIYEYRLIKRNDEKYFLQFRLGTVDLKSKKEFPYLANFKGVGTNRRLYYCDFFPAVWEDHPDKLNKLLSKETGVMVNIRKITVTCFYIFHEQIAAENSSAVFIVSGSLLKGEELLPGINISRKLKLYREILVPHGRDLGYRAVEILNYNAVAFVKNQNKTDDSVIQGEYADFKNRD